MLKEVESLSKNLGEMEDKLVTRSVTTCSIDERLYAISELRYHKELLREFEKLSIEDKTVVLSDIKTMVDEVKSWWL